MPNDAGFRAAIFDFDGVIADSIPLHFESFRRVFAEEGAPFTMEDYRRVANGRPRDHVIRAVIGSLEASRLADLMDRKERYIFEILAEKGLRPIPGSLELVKSLRDRGLRTAVASSSRTARRFLEALKGCGPGLERPAALFDAILESDGLMPPKPDPEIFLRAARALGVPPGECLAFEDARNGVQAARAAGMRVIAITTTEKAEALGESHAIYSSFSEIDPDAILLEPLT